ncbi:MAG TPA: HEAT repeat domain-containing protein [Planctomycetota bacterium]|nr:HEAT repeat domain-containing protein [Planctomycetota bacterium]
MGKHLALAAIAAFLCLSADAQTALEGLKDDHQKKLYYKTEELPACVTALIADDVAVDELVRYHDAAKNEILKFNIILVLDKKVRNKTIGQADIDTCLALFTKCLTEGNPWIKTEAVFALGNANGKEALPQIVRCLDDPSATVVYHAVMAHVMITKNLPRMTEAQQRKFIKAQEAVVNDRRNELADAELADYTSTQVY